MKNGEKDEQKFDRKNSDQDNTVSEDLEFVEDDEESNPREAIRKLRDALRVAKKERQEYLEGWQRMKADAVNAKRQEEEWRKEFVKFAEEKLVFRLLPVLESFSMATANKEAWENLPKDWRVGMEYIYRELLTALSEHGLSEIDPKVGEKFDPSVHTSIGSTVTDDVALDHTIASVAQKGYSFGGKILKPARVHIFDISNS